MPIKVKDEAFSASKWSTRSQAAVPDYESGLDRADNWEQNSKSQEGAYKTGTTAAMGRGAYGKGITRAGNAKWLRNSKTKGVERYPGGVAAAEADYQAGVAPYFALMRSFPLGPKGPRGSAANFQRSTKLGQALNRKRTGGGPIGTVG